MATISGFKFDTPDGAEKMVDLIEGLSKQQLIVLQDAALVVWPEGKKKPSTKQLADMTGSGAVSGAFWGMLFGLLFFVPFFGMAVGAAMGALSGHFTNYGIDKDFVEQARSKVTEGTSALFLMTSDVVGDKVLDAIKNSGLEFEMFYSNLSKEQEAQLREDFGA
jgi:uncharacterized membrane protein